MVHIWFCLKDGYEPRTLIKKIEAKCYKMHFISILAMRKKQRAVKQSQLAQLNTLQTSSLFLSFP